MFDVYDVDGDGFISRSDMLTMLRNRAGSQLTDEQLAELVDGAMAHLPLPRVPGEERRISFKEFCKVRFRRRSHKCWLFESLFDSIERETPRAAGMLARCCPQRLHRQRD